MTWRKLEGYFTQLKNQILTDMGNITLVTPFFPERPIPANLHTFCRAGTHFDIELCSYDATGWQYHVSLTSAGLKSNSMRQHRYGNKCAEKQKKIKNCLTNHMVLARRSEAGAESGITPKLTMFQCNMSEENIQTQ